MSVNVSGGDLQWDANINLSGFNAQLNQIRNGLNSLVADQKNQANFLEEFSKKAAAAAAGYFSIQAASDFVQSMVRVRGEFQQIEVAYRTMLGSKEKADQLMAESVKLAAITPFTLQDVASGSKQLLAYGFAAKDITENLEMLGNVASGVGSQLGDLTYLYGTLKASGRVTQMDINQFAGRGIPIYQALADVMKINVEQVREYVSAGKVGFPDVERAFNKLTSAGGQFYNLMQEQSKTLTGQLSNLEDAWSRMLNELGQQNEGLFADAISGAIDLVDNYQEILDILGDLIASYGVYRAVLLLGAAATSVATYAAAGFTAAEILQFYWTKTLTKAQALLNLTMLANPYVAVTAALAALGTYLYLASENTAKLKTAAELTAEAMGKQGDAVETSEAKLKVYVEMLKNSNLSEGERLNIYNKIKAIDPSIVKGIDEKTISYGKLKDSVNAYIASLRQKFAAEANEGAIKASIQNENEIRKQIEGVGNEGFKFSLGRITGDKDIEEAEDLKKLNALKNTLLQQQIETNKLIGKSIQTGSAEQIKAAENDLKALNEQKKLYKKGSIEYTTVQQQAIEKLDELNKLRQLKSKETADASAPVKYDAGKNKAYYDAIVKENTEALEALDKGSKDFNSKAAIFKKKIQDAQRELLSFDVSGKRLAKANDDLFKWGEKKLDILNKISDAEAELAVKNLSQNEAEIAQNKLKYTQLRRDLEEYNREAAKAGKALLGKEVFARVDNAEAKEDYSIRYRQDTEKLKTKLELDKQLYADYEDFKTKYGEDKAKERFGNEVKSNKDLIGQLNYEFGKLVIKSISGNLSAEEKKRFEQVAKDIKGLTDLEQQRFDSAYEMALTHSQNIDRINAQYRNAALALGKNITEEQKSELSLQRDNAIEAAKDEVLTKSNLYKKLSVDTIELTREQVKVQIAALKDLLESGALNNEIKTKIESQLSDLNAVLKIGIDQTNLKALKQRIADTVSLLNSTKDGKSIISESEFKRLTEELAKLQGELRKTLNTSSGGAKSNFVKGIEANFEYLKGSTADVATGVANDLGQVSGSFNELSNALGGTNTEAGYTLDTIGRLVGVAADAAGAVGSFASGDIIGGVTKTIKAISGLFSIASKVKEMNAAARKEVEDFYTKAAEGERAYQALLRQRELDEVRRGKNSYQAIVAQLDLLKKQSPEIQAAYDKIFASLQGQSSVSGVGYEHGTWFRKAKTWDIMASLMGSDYDKLEKLYTENKLKDQAKTDFEALKQLREELKNAGVDVQDLQAQLNELLTGTSVSGLADGLSQLFENGKFAAEDFGQSFEDIMKKAMINSFKYKLLEDALTPFYNEFAALFTNGTPDQAAIDALRAKYVALGVEFGEKFKDLERVTGISFTETNVVPVVVDVVVDSDFENFKDRVAELLRNTATPVEEFGQLLEDEIKSRIFAGFKAQVFADGLKAFNDKLVSFTKSGNPLTQAQIAELKIEYFKFIDDAKLKMADLEKVSGISFAEIIKNEVGGAASAIDNEFQSIQDSILGIFANTENATEDFANNFQSIIKKAILESFRATALGDQLKEFYEQFKEFSNSGDGLTQERIAILKAQYDQIIRDGQSKMSDLEKITGVTVNSSVPKSSAMASSIGRTITEETAGVLSSTWMSSLEELVDIANAMRISNTIGQQIVTALARIEQNTYRTANNTNNLDGKLDALISAMRGNGGTSVSQQFRDEGLSF